MTDSIQEKVKHVKSQRQSRNHVCHWIGCDEQCPPAMWGCKFHWFKLPKALRDRVWLNYRIGQEVSGNVSKAYLDAADEVEKWIKQNNLATEATRNG